MSEEQNKNVNVENAVQHFPEDSHAPQLKPETPNPKPQTDPMEVHKHPHHVMHKKKWNEYLLEFFMLFLAVFLGFIAENIRESQLEKQRAQEYLRSFYTDLKSDTARMSYIVNGDTKKLTALNQIKNCYDTVTKNWQNNSCLLTLIAASRSNRSFQITDRTLKQLDNAGGYRLLKEQDADSILSYENDYSNYHDFQTTIFQEAQDNVRNTLTQIADFTNVFSIDGTNMLSIDTYTNEIKGSLLFSKDTVLLNKWFNQLSIYQRVIGGQVKQLTLLSAKAISLLNYFNNKYHFENKE